MAEDSSRKAVGFAINKCGKTSFHSEKFTYTWVIEGFNTCQNETTSLDILSPKINVNKYAFQLVVNPKRETSVGSGVFYFYLDLTVLTCPISETNMCVRLCVLKASDGTDYEPTEKILTITKNAVFKIYSLTPSKVYTDCLSDNNLTVKCTFTFRRSICSDKLEDSGATECPSTKTSILDDYEKLLNTAKFSDVTLIVGDKEFSAHKNILSVRSPVFCAMFEHDMIENKKNTVEITDIEPEVMAEVLSFIYANKVNNISELTTGLFAAADKYELDALRLMCENVFLDKLSLDNLAETLKIVDQYETCPRLREAVLQFVSLNGNEVANWKKFDKVMKTLSPSMLLEVTKATMLKA